MEYIINPRNTDKSSFDSSFATKELLDAVASTSRKDYMKNAAKLLESSFVQTHFPMVKMEFMNACEGAISRPALVAVLEVLLTDPYKYRKGWPDLTLIRNRKPLFIEVKTTDKLHKSQLDTIPVMRSASGAEFRVIRVGVS